jgi:L-alanine-DL-glutamate epimerase-like enolase superfamily enzyme
VEEVLPPYDFEGFGRLRRKITSTNIATGEHIYGRYGFAKLLKADGASIWQPDVGWCGGMSELRKIGALADAYDIPVIPHNGGANGAVHWSISHVNAPWSELFMPAPGGPKKGPKASTSIPPASRVGAGTWWRHRSDGVMRCRAGSGKIPLDRPVPLGVVARSTV